jgi:hypothetical protein
VCFYVFLAGFLVKHELFFGFGVIYCWQRRLLAGFYGRTLVKYRPLDIRTESGIV